MEDEIGFLAWRFHGGNYTMGLLPTGNNADEYKHVGLGHWSAKAWDGMPSGRLVSVEIVLTKVRIAERSFKALLHASKGTLYIFCSLHEVVCRSSSKMCIQL
jgi:hypothetical protein